MIYNVFESWLSKSFECNDFDPRWWLFEGGKGLWCLLPLIIGGDLALNGAWFLISFVLKCARLLWECTDFCGCDCCRLISFGFIGGGGVGFLPLDAIGLSEACKEYTDFDCDKVIGIVVNLFFLGGGGGRWGGGEGRSRWGRNRKRSWK